MFLFVKKGCTNHVHGELYTLTEISTGFTRKSDSEGTSIKNDQTKKEANMTDDKKEMNINGNKKNIYWMSCFR